jgi:hypothetical protein
MISAHWYLRGRNAEESDRCGSAHIEERLLRIAAYTAHSSSGEGREPAIGFKLRSVDSSERCPRSTWTVLRSIPPRQPICRRCCAKLVKPEASVVHAGTLRNPCQSQPILAVSPSRFVWGRQGRTASDACNEPLASPRVLLQEESCARAIASERSHTPASPSLSSYDSRNLSPHGIWTRVTAVKGRKQTGSRCNYKAAVALQCPVRNS